MHKIKLNHLPRFMLNKALSPAIFCFSFFLSSPSSLFLPPLFSLCHLTWKLWVRRPQRWAHVGTIGPAHTHTHTQTEVNSYLPFFFFFSTLKAISRLHLVSVGHPIPMHRERILEIRELMSLVPRLLPIGSEFTVRLSQPAGSPVSFIRSLLVHIPSSSVRELVKWESGCLQDRWEDETRLTSLYIYI